jgi:glycosyltransferase involved in cell wall biosynthesis
LTKIWACYVLYNEVGSIADSIKSIMDFADCFVFIDGAFQGHPLENDNAKSTDGTVALLEKLVPEKKRTIIQTETPWSTQTEARNQYLKHVPAGDWVFIIDGDESVHGDKQQTRRELAETKSNVFGVLIETLARAWGGSGANIPEDQWRSLPKCPIFGYSPRFYRSTGNLAYQRQHSAIYDGTTKIAQNQGALINGDNLTRSIRILNDTTQQSWRKYQDGIIYRKSKSRSHGE